MNFYAPVEIITSYDCTVLSASMHWFDSYVLVFVNIFNSSTWHFKYRNWSYCSPVGRKAIKCHK